MLEEVRAQSIADLPVQHPRKPATEAQRRARFFNSGNAFDVKLPAVPDHTFTSEPARALDAATGTGFIACDLSSALGCAFPATSPFILARYARIRAGETLTAQWAASGVVTYVIAGAGELACAGETIAWSEGDVLLLPGGVEHRYRAGDRDCVLWLVSNEPQLAFEHARAPAPGAAPTAVVHYPHAEIEHQIGVLHEVGRGPQTAGTALIFSAAGQEATRNALPTLTVAMNSLAAGEVQPPHRHNSVAVSLVVQGPGCFSMIDGRRKDWSPWATTVTPPCSAHSHHNAGAEAARFLIVQDGGLFYHARAMGFEFVGSS